MTSFVNGPLSGKKTKMDMDIYGDVTTLGWEERLRHDGRPY